jgi:hypothetical protein
MIDEAQVSGVYEEKDWIWHKLFTNFAQDVASAGKLVTSLKGNQPNSVRP